MSILIIAKLVYDSDLSSLISILGNINLNLFLLSSLFLLFINFISIFRFHILVNRQIKLNLFQSAYITFLGNAFNLILPAKLGDIFKFKFLPKNKFNNDFDNLSVTLFEKLLDLVGLFFCITVLFVFIKYQDKYFYLEIILLITLFIFFFYIFSMKLRTLLNKLLFFNRIFFFKKILIALDNFIFKLREGKLIFLNFLLSFLIWLLHLVQLWTLTLCIDLKINLIENLYYFGLAILSGLMPFTYAGLGSRDVAFQYFFYNEYSYESILALGLLSFSRYLIPGLIGFMMLISKFIFK